MPTSITGSTAASSATSPPIRSSTNTAQINLGEVAGGVRLFWTELVAGVINWSLAAPLFSINYVLLDAALRRSLRPIKTLLSPAGVEGLVEQGVRVLRWGLWMAPVINSFLRQSPDPTWYNQDGAIRTGVAIGANATQSPADFRQFSLAMFTGLLAYDWLRILIWFDHMGLRVATLVNLSFLGGDRADEAAARFVGHHGRTRAIPDGIRRFGTWAPLLIPFYIPRGPEWDKAWTGAETLARGGAPMPDAVRTLALAYAASGAAIVAASVAAFLKERAKIGSPAPWLDGAPVELARRPDRYTFNNGAVGVEIQRDGRGAGFRYGRGAGRLRNRPLSPAARSAAGARPFLLCERGGRGALVDRLRTGATRGRLSHRGDRLQPSRDRQRAERDRGAHGDLARSRGRDPELAHSAGKQIKPVAAAATHEFLRDRRPRDRRRTRRISISPACMSKPCSCVRSTPYWRATGSCGRRAPIAARPRSSPSSPARERNSSATKIRASASSARARC